MAIIYPTIWEQGDKRERLSLGYHYKKHVKSLVVPEGQIVTIYENQDRTGRKSLPLHAGNYHHLSFYGISENPGVVHIEKTGVRLLDLVEIGWNIDYDKELMKRTRGREGKYPIYYAVPIGDKRQGVDFPNDRIQWLKIPFGVIVEVFDDDYFKGGSLIFSGNTQGEKERVNLWDYKDAKGNPYSWRTSSMKIRADDWVSAGVSIENESISAKDNDKFAGVFELGNNSPFDTEVSQEVEVAIESSVEENWNIGAAVTTSAGVEAGPEVCKVSVDLSVEVSGGYGESKTKTKSRSVTYMVSAQLPPWSVANGSMIVEEGELEGDLIRKWRNLRTGTIIEEKGRIKIKNGARARGEIHGTEGEAPVTNFRTDEIEIEE